ncbi:MAG TPA: protein-disulfide reductase DsbD domain-containing protein [Terriglobia bacterium]|jgi:thiol:disulfide interchange protein DsbD|nr:protein-disulfide reductase DsbD domain-containing protein [Terriglobia bacterium]
MRKLTSVVTSCLIFVAAGLAQAPTVVTGHLVLDSDAVHPGTTVKAAVVAEVAPGYHINDHVPSLDYLIPTQLKLDTAPPLNLADTKYPKGSPQKFSFLDTPISVYQGKLVVGAEIKVASGAQPGAYTLKGTLDYQACNDHACLPPTSVPLTLSIKVVPRSEPLKPANTDVFKGLKFN